MRAKGLSILSVALVAGLGVCGQPDPNNEKGGPHPGPIPQVGHDSHFGFGLRQAHHCVPSPLSPLLRQQPSRTLPRVPLPFVTNRTLSWVAVTVAALDDQPFDHVGVWWMRPRPSRWEGAKVPSRSEDTAIEFVARANRSEVRQSRTKKRSFLRGSWWSPRPLRSAWGY